MPGHCGLLYNPLFGAGWAAGRRRGGRKVIHRIAVLQPVLVKVALLVSAVGPVTVDSPLLATGRQDERSTNDAAWGGWPRAAFVFGDCYKIFAADFRASHG